MTNTIDQVKLLDKISMEMSDRQKKTTHLIHSIQNIQKELVFLRLPDKDDKPKHQQLKIKTDDFLLKTSNQLQESLKHLCDLHHYMLTLQCGTHNIMSREMKKESGFKRPNQTPTDDHLNKKPKSPPIDVEDEEDETTPIRLRVKGLVDLSRDK